MGEVVSFAEATGHAGSNADIASWLVAMADLIRDHPRKLSTIMLVVEGPGGTTLSKYTTGTVPLDLARGIGLLTLMISRMATGDSDDELGI